MTFVGSSFLFREAREFRHSGARAGQTFGKTATSPGRPRPRPGNEPALAACSLSSAGSCSRAFGSSFASSACIDWSSASDGPPPMRPRNLFSMPPLRPIVFIMSAIWRCILRSLLMSSTLVPEPAAMRLLALGIEQFGLRALLRGHRRDDGALALEDSVVEARCVDLLLHLADAGQHAHARRPCRRSSASAAAGRRGRRGRRRPSASSRRSSAAFSTSMVCGGLFDQADDVAHAEDAAGDAVGMEILERVHFSPMPISLIGLPVTARIESAAPPRPSPSTRVSTMPVMPTRSSNAWREVDGVLAGQRVGDEQDFVRVGRGLDVAASRPSALRRCECGRRCRA